MKIAIPHPCILALCALSPFSAVAQTAPVRPEAPPAPAADAIVLSPFTVATDRDTGFVAASALSGGRLSSDLRDTAVDYSVLTREFIDALNLTEVTDAARWTVNSYDPGDSGDSGGLNGGSMGQANVSRLRFRGLQTNTPQVDFFPAAYDFDAFSIERIDFARGASGVLFGTGTFSGTPNAVLKRARTDKSTAEFKLTGGSWDFYRGTIDANYAFNPKFGVRVNLLKQDANTYRQNEFNRHDGYALSATYRPFSRTRIDFAAGTGNIERNVGSTVIRDFFSSWDGQTTFSGVQGARTGTQQGGQYPNGNGTTTGKNFLQAGVNRYGSDTNPYWIIRMSDPGKNVWNYANIGRTATLETENGALGNLIGGQVAPVAGTAVTGLRGTSLLNNFSTVDYLYDNAIRFSNYRTPSRAWTTLSKHPNTTQNYDTLTLGGNQQVGKHLFLEAAGNYTGVTRKSLTTNVNTVPVYIDINRHLPDGSANPRFLDPYMEKESGRGHSRNISRAGRVGAALVFNETKWGDYTLSVSGGKSLVSDWNRSEIMALKDANPGAGTNPTGDPRLWPYSNIPRYWMYFNEGYYDDLAPGITTLNDVRMVGTGPTAAPVYSTRRAEIGYALRSATARRFEADYQLAALQAKLFKKRLSLLAAARRDAFLTQSRNTWAQVPSRAELPADWDGLSAVYRPKAPADYFALSYRTRDSNGNQVGAPQLAVTRPRNANGTPQALYLRDRFQDDYSIPDQEVSDIVYSAGAVLHVTRWLSLTGSYGESFDSPSLTPRITGENFDPVVSKTHSFGLRLDFGSRASFTASRYSGEQSNVAINANTGLPLTLLPSSNLNFIINANAADDLSPDGYNRRGLSPVIGSYAESAGRKTSGYEFELVANLVRGLRVTLNYALPDAYLTNGYLDTKAYLAQNLDTLKLIVQDAGGVIDPATNRASLRPVDDPLRGINAGEAVNGWNGLVDLQRAFPDGATRETRLNKHSANVFFDYTLQSGRLRGLRIGAGGNWRGPSVIGNYGTATIKDPASTNPVAVIDDPTVGPSDYVWAGGYYQITGTLGYEFKLKDRRTLRFDLKVENLTDYDRPVYYATVTGIRNKNPADPGRTVVPDAATFVRPRYWELSSTLKF